LTTSVTISVLVVYLCLLAGFGIWSRKETHTLSGFYLAGKKLPAWVVAFSTNATGESGWLLLGLTGMGYAVGMKAYWVVVGEIAGIAASWWFVSRRLKRLGDETHAITVPDVLAAKFDDKLHLVRGVAVVIILTMVSTYVAAQMVASGKALSTFVGMNYETAVIAGAVIIIGYTFVGGYKAVSYTDVLQGVLMFVGLIVVPFTTIAAVGGWDAVIENVGQQDPALTSMFAFTAEGTAGWIAVIGFIGIGLPFLGVPQLLIRYMSARDDRELVKARYISVGVLFVFTFGAVTAGIAGRALFPGLEDTETIFPVLSKELFPPLVSGVLLVVVLSAIMSTVDSLLLLASSAVVRDTMQKIMGSTKTDAELSNYGKFVTILIGAFGITFALIETPLIFWFVLFAWSGLGAAFGPVIVCLLYDKKTTREGVIAGMLGGFLTSVIWVVFIKDQAYGLYEAIPGFVVAFAATIIVSRLTNRAGVAPGHPWPPRH
jgi:sodium/proline symporter